MTENNTVRFEDLDPTTRQDVDSVLAYHGVEAGLPSLMFACLACGSIGVSQSESPVEGEIAEWHKQFNAQCCGYTVLFNTSG